jgi:multicomponent K+:H+ antiporter subunit D
MSPLEHAPILPILIPFAAALLQMAGGGIGAQRRIGLAAALAGIAAAAGLAALADSGPARVYALGDWPPPFGIALVADRLAAGMALLTAALAAACLLYASHGADAAGRHFHPLFQFQVVGLQGAFLTGDLFSLFVFFEIMLLASYALLAHGGGAARTRAGLAYVVINLAGSAVFLVALGLIYGTLGTLNLADIARKLQTGGPMLPLARLGGALLSAVFLLKAALLPLSFWLPRAYTSAAVPVAALFVLMTKVGVVSLLRVQAVAFGPSPGAGDLLAGWLAPLALATVVFAALGVYAADRLRALAAWLALGSAGVLLLAPAAGEIRVTAAALYYLTQSTLAGAALFLLAGLLAERRGASADFLVAGPPPQAPALAAALLVVLAAAAGLPPLAGFLGKLMLLDALTATPFAAASWAVLLGAGLVVLLALARAGSLLFWETRPDLPPAPTPAGWRRASAVALLVGAAPLLALAATPLAGYAMRAADQLHAPNALVRDVLGAPAAGEQP